METAPPKHKRTWFQAILAAFSHCMFGAVSDFHPAQMAFLDGMPPKKD